jgi:hypothetical protein
MKIAVMLRQLDRGHILWCGPVVRVERAHRVRVVRGVQKMSDVGNGVIGFDLVRFHVRDLVMAFLEDERSDAACRSVVCKLTVMVAAGAGVVASRIHAMERRRRIHLR